MSDLDQTRAKLAQIPALAAQLPQFLTGATPKGDEAKIKRLTSTSRPPVDVGLLDLINGRDIEWWVMLAIDEMVENDIEPKAAPTSRTPDIGENCQWLSRNAEWIAENNPDFCTEIQALYWQYRRAAGQTPPQTFKCFTCGGEAFISDGQWLICREVDEHARTVKSIENEHRFKPAVPAEQIVKEYPVDLDKLRDWKRRGRLRAVAKDGKRNLYYPWDVFLILNPAIREALDARDTANAR